MYRLFVAVPLPEGVKERILELRSNIPGARWMGSEQLHVTLKFIGAVEGHSAETIRECLSCVTFSPFPLQFKGVGFFPSGVLWTGIAHPEEIAALRRRIENTLFDAGIPRERRKFSPHVTVARLKNSPLGSVKRFLKNHDSFRTESFIVDRFILFSSILKPSGAVYTVEAEYFFDRS